MTPDDDTLLVRRACDGDREAFGELVTRYGLLVNGLCRGMTGSVMDAQDLAHDAFVEAWLKLSSLRDPAFFAPWLRTLTLNLCRMWHRRRRRERQELSEMAGSPSCAAADNADALEALSLGMSRLSTNHRLVLALHYLEGLTYEQLAAFLGVAPGTVMSRLHRAREKLKLRMEEMSATDARSEPAEDGFRQAIDAEIQVLLGLWEEAARSGNPYALHDAAPTRLRLSALLAASPQMVNPVLRLMDPILERYICMLLRGVGQPAMEHLLAAAMGEDADQAARARNMLRLLLSTHTGQPNTEPAFHLPMRQTAALIADAVVRRSRPDADKAELLVDILAGCDDAATTVLMGGVLLCYPDQGYPLLWNRWWRTRDGARPGRDPYLATLARFGTRFLESLHDELGRGNRDDLGQALFGVQVVANKIGFSTLTREPGPDPALEQRTSAGLRAEEIDDHVLELIRADLAVLSSHESSEIRNVAIATLGELGHEDAAPVLRACLSHEDASTRAAAVVALQNLENPACVPELMHIVRHDVLAAQRAAVHALGVLRAAAAEDLLIELTADENLRAQAISALGEIGGESGRTVLRDLVSSTDKKVARMAAGALFGGKRTARPASATTRERLDKVRGKGARPLLHISVVGAIRNLPEIRPYTETEITRLIGAVCGDYSSTRRHLVMGPDGLMTRSHGLYELTDIGKAIWRVERLIRDRYLGGGM